MSELVIAPASASEVIFVYDSWIKGWRTSRWAGCIPNNVFHQTTKDAIHQLLTRGANLHVARSGGRALGWLCHEATEDGRLVVHAAYVKSAYRGFPVLDALVAHACADGATCPGFYTYRTDFLERGLRDLNKGPWTHAPEIARRK